MDYDTMHSEIFGKENEKNELLDLIPFSGPRESVVFPNLRADDENSNDRMSVEAVEQASLEMTASSISKSCLVMSLAGGFAPIPDEEYI